MKEEIKKIQNEELEDVTGGSCYSGSSYATLGVEPHKGLPKTDHPLITTVWNNCAAWEQSPDWTSIVSHRCENCAHCAYVNLKWICLTRSKEHDSEA